MLSSPGLHRKQYTLLHGAPHTYALMLAHVRPDFHSRRNSGIRGFDIGLLFRIHGSLLLGRLCGRLRLRCGNTFCCGGRRLCGGLRGGRIGGLCRGTAGDEDGRLRIRNENWCLCIEVVVNSATARSLQQALAHLLLCRRLALLAGSLFRRSLLALNPAETCTGQSHGTSSSAHAREATQARNHLPDLHLQRRQALCKCVQGPLLRLPGAQHLVHLFDLRVYLLGLRLRLCIQGPPRLVQSISVVPH
mmetsp:Transcript_103223/g.330945  ORF Transcript_103223/g.330945 Transcript_103223/m.330945 type:complete len:247 (+) Transcript_103223:3-743(+)